MKLEWLAVVVMLAAAALVRVPSLDRPLVEAHSFRQTQTAFTAVDFADHGIDLLHPKVPAVGPPFEFAMEFPLFQAIASVPISFGIDADVSLRVTALAFFLLTAALLFGLLRYVTTKVVAFAALFVFLFSPFALLWSRASMIEYLATAGALGWVYAGVMWRDSGRRWLLVVAVIAGVIAMTVKVTTGVFWVLPLILYQTSGERLAPMRGAWMRARLQAPFAILVGVPFVAGVLWTKWADHVKQGNPPTRWATSSALADFNFGSLNDRLEWGRWSTISSGAQELLIGAKGLWLVLIVVAVWRARHNMFWIGIALTVCVTPLVFFNLYYLHDYYLAAISPGVAALLGLVVQQLWTRLPRIPRSVLAVALGCTWLVLAFIPARDYVQLIYRSPDGDPYLEAARELRTLTAPGDLVIVEASDLNPTPLYYSDRRGIVLFPDIRKPSVLDPLPEQPYRYLYVLDRDNLALLDQWDSVGVVGPHTYTLGSRSGNSPVRATTRGLAPYGGEATRLRCDGSTLSMPAGSEAILEGEPVEGLRLRFGDRLGPLPWARTLRFSEPLELSCTGPEAIDLRVSGVRANVSINTTVAPRGGPHVWGRVGIHARGSAHAT